MVLMNKWKETEKARHEDSWKDGKAEKPSMKAAASDTHCSQGRQGQGWRHILEVRLSS